jgi:hypothetical protein
MDSSDQNQYNTVNVRLDDFDDEPIYIRKKVRSCSDFRTMKNLSPSIPTDDFKQRVLQELYSDAELELYQKPSRLEYRPIFDRRSASINVILSDSKSDDGRKGASDTLPRNQPNDFSVSSSDNSVEEWNAEEETFSSKRDIKNKSFSDRFYSSPKTFSATFTKVINNLFENPEGRMTSVQKITIIVFTVFEAYRTIISSFLTVFVPQSCDGYSCTILQNIMPKDNLEIAAISINTFMALYFCLLFTIEKARESIVTKFLIADKTAATNKDYLVQMLSEMNANERQTILGLNRIYRIFAQLLLFLFFINAGISCVVIRKNYLNNTTITVFITNTFFMINRIHKALKITSSGEYNIYSAYRSDSLLYNRNRGTWLQKETSIHMV